VAPRKQDATGTTADVVARKEGWPSLTPPDIPRDFCSERVHTLDEDACFALPERRSEILLIYLHGIVPPTRDSVQKTNLDEVVANASERAGVVALIPRGKQGHAPQAYRDWWGWPTSKGAYEQHGSEFIAKIREKRDKLAALLEASFTRTYLAGSSSGAYFAAAVALHGGMPEVDGFGILSGGSGYATEEFTVLVKKSVYIGYGKHDSVAGGARALGQRFSAAGWPVMVAAHDVGHGARAIYLDEAFAFWQGGIEPQRRIEPPSDARDQRD
jgi:predicted esterase